MSVLIPIVVIIILIILNGLFVAAEFAIVGSRRTRVEKYVEEGNAAARYVQRILSTPENQDRYIAIAQLGITLASIGLGMYGEQSIAGWLYGPLEQYGGLGYAASHTVGTIVAVAFLTYFHVVIGEMIPKALALQKPEETSFRVARPMRIMGTLFRPAVWALNGAGTLLMRAMGIPEPDAHSRVYTPQELELIVGESSEAGALESEQQELIANIFDFSERDVGQLMTPRPRVIGLSVDSAKEDLTALIRSGQHSRFPVYEEDLDHIVGLLHIKDFIRQQTQAEPFNLRPLLRRAPRVPEGMAAENLLESFKRLKIHMAVVMDEFGGTAGIVTLEDLLEEVVGEVQDEFDRETPPVQRVDDHTLLVRGDVLLDDLNEHHGFDLSSETSDTVAGLLLDELGRPPEAGDEATLEEVHLKAEEVEGLVIQKVRLTQMDKADEEDASRGNS